MNQDKIYDFVAIGVGPFNLSLACLTAPIVGLDGIFLDKRQSFNWHPGMLLQDTTLQVPFLADLVTMSDPTSPFSFLNYIKEQGRIYSFYIRENFKLLRNEYNHYCQWAIQKLPNVHFNTRVEEVTYDEVYQYYKVECYCGTTGEHKSLKTLRLVLGTGTVPYVPASCREHLDKVVHSAAYLDKKAKLQTKRSITVVGSGQSAAEIYYDLLQEIDVYGYELHWLTRSPRFYPLEYSKLTLEMTSPEYVDYFYSLPIKKRDQLNKEQKGLYKGINNDLIASIFDTLYAKRLVEDIKVSLRTNSEMKRATYLDEEACFELELYQEEEEKYYRHHTEGLVLATGYSYKTPDFLKKVSSRIQWDEKGRYDVNRNYSIDSKGKEIFVQNAELHTHGFSTPDLGMGCYRNSFIIEEITGKDYYPREQRIAFQQFAVSDAEQTYQTSSIPKLV